MSERQYALIGVTREYGPNDVYLYEEEAVLCRGTRDEVQEYVRDMATLYENERTHELHLDRMNFDFLFARPQVENA